MLIEETFRIKLPIEELWKSALNPEIMGPCVPGCEKVEAISEKEYDSIIKANVGFISVRFRVKTIIEEMVPYKLIRAVGEGKELRNLGSFRQKTSIHFSELSRDETEVSYRSEVSIVGRLATFGDRVLRHKASELGKQFVENVHRELSPQGKDSPSPTEALSLIQKVIKFFERILRRLTHSQDPQKL